MRCNAKHLLRGNFLVYLLNKPNFIGEDAGLTLDALATLSHQLHFDDEGNIRDLLITKFLSQGEKGLPLESKQDCLPSEEEKDDFEEDDRSYSETEDYTRTETAIDEETSEEVEEVNQNYITLFDSLKTMTDLNFNQIKRTQAQTVNTLEVIKNELNLIKSSLQEIKRNIGGNNQAPRGRNRAQGNNEMQEEQQQPQGGGRGQARGRGGRRGGRGARRGRGSRGG